MRNSEVVECQIRNGLPYVGLLPPPDTHPTTRINYESFVVDRIGFSRRLTPNIHHSNLGFVDVMSCRQRNKRHFGRSIGGCIKGQ